jgi:hypothetical protein
MTDEPLILTHDPTGTATWTFPDVAGNYYVLRDTDYHDLMKMLAEWRAIKALWAQETT